MDGSIEWKNFIQLRMKMISIQRQKVPTMRNPSIGTTKQNLLHRKLQKRHERANETQLLAWRRGEKCRTVRPGKRLTEMLYLTPPLERLGFMKDLIDIARQERCTIAGYFEQPNTDQVELVRQAKYLHRNSSDYCTISQAASNYCKRFWKANVGNVVYGRTPEPPTGLVN